MHRFLFALALAAFALPAVACSNDSTSASGTCGCTINGTDYACGTETCVDGERVACSSSAEISTGGACTAPTDAGQPRDAGNPVVTDAGTKPDAAPPRDAGPACDQTSKFPCGTTTCTTGVEYCSALLSTGSKCKMLATKSCATCASSGEYMSFVSLSANLCTGGKRAFCDDGNTGGQMTWGCR